MPGFPHRALFDRQAYRYLDGADRTDLAWEWLRRIPDYGLLAPGTHRWTEHGWIVDPAPAEITARWGCLYIADARLCWRDAVMLWSAHCDVSVLRVEALPYIGNDADAFDLRRYAARATTVAGADGRQHLLVRGRSAVRLDVIGGTLLDGPASLRLDVSGIGHVDRATAALRDFLHLCRGGALPLKGTRLPPRAIDALRVHDALAQGASIRDIGVLLFGPERVQAEWRAPGESLKSQCRRRIALARHMIGGGFRELLR